MSDDPDMDTNFVVDDPAGRHNSSVDIQGYSMLPDIVWTPGTEMLNSKFGKIIFTNVKDSYPTNEDLLCTYTVVTGIDVKDDDRVAIFCVGWRKFEEAIAWVLVAKHPWPNEEISVVFRACQLPTPDNRFYQFCYLSAGEVRGASIPFTFVNNPNVNADQQRALYFRNHQMDPQINIVSNGVGSLHTVAAGHPQNFILSSSDRSSMIQNDLPTNCEESDTSCSEVTSSEQYAPTTQNEKQKNMSGTSSRSMSRDDDTQPAESSSQMMDSAEIAVTPCQCLQTGCVDSEIAKWRARLHFEVEKNQILSANLQRSQAEVERQMRQYDTCLQNNKVVVRELENELYNKKLRIADLHNIISEKDRTIAYFTQRYGPINERAIAYGGPAQFPPDPGYTDGQLEQEGHVGIGASSGRQRQDSRTSTTHPFYAALRKTRNYYITFLSDKADIELKVFALSAAKLSFIKKLHTMKERKEMLMRQEYRYYTALQGMRGVQNDESRRVLEAITEGTAKLRALDAEALTEVGVVEEIKRRLEINRDNMCTLRAKAFEVFSKFLASLNYCMDHNNGAVQAEVEYMQYLYEGLDNRFLATFELIEESINNTYIWD